MKVQGLGSSLTLGAGGAILLVFLQHVFAASVGSWNVLVLHLAAMTVAYAALIGKHRRASYRNAGLAAVGAATVLILARGASAGIAEVAIGFTLVLALVRSGLEPALRGPRALVVESLLGVGALGFAAWLAAPGWLGSAVAFWGYALVQSLHFLVPLTRRSLAGPQDGDPFDRAHERLIAMLDEV